MSRPTDRPVTLRIDLLYIESPLNDPRHIDSALW